MLKVLLMKYAIHDSVEKTVNVVFLPSKLKGIQEEYFILLIWATISIVKS